MTQKQSETKNAKKRAKQADTLISAIACFFFILLLAQNSSAMGIACRSPNDIVDFEPNTVVTRYYAITTASKDVSISVGGELANITELSKKYIKADDPDKTFSVTINLPEKIDTPGLNGLAVIAEQGSSGSGVGTAIMVQFPFYIRVPYPGQYIETSLGIGNVAVNETVKFRVRAINRGLETISDLRAKITVHDSDNNFVDSFYTTSEDLEPKQTKELIAEMETTKMTPGDYQANSTVFYPGKNYSTASFRIGSQQTKIIKYTKSFFVGKINQFEVQIFNDWNKPMDNVYAEILINTSSYKTPIISLNPWNYGTVTGYLDASPYEEGVYDAQIWIYYPDGKVFEQTKLEFIKEKAAVKEWPAFFSTTTILVTVIIILVLITAYLFLKTREIRKRISSEGEAHEKEEIKYSESSKKTAYSKTKNKKTKT